LTADRIAEEAVRADVSRIGILSHSIIENIGSLGDIMIYTFILSLLTIPLKLLSGRINM